MIDSTLLEIRNLSVAFDVEGGRLLAVDDFNLSLVQGETLGIVGESGSGKSVCLRACLGLLPKSRSEVKGEVFFNGSSLSQLSPKELSAWRGKYLGFVQQDPVSSLNPFLSVGEQVWEGPWSQGKISKSDRIPFAIETLRSVGIADAEKRWQDYPHQFSGGMCQRVVIAAALANQPSLMIADEPTTSLDVTVEKQIMDLLASVSEQKGVSQIVVTHNLRLALWYCDRIAIMYGGVLLEYGQASHLLSNPRHPYTQYLMELAKSTASERRQRRSSHERRAPELTRWLQNGEKWSEGLPAMLPVNREDGHWVRPLWVEQGWWEVLC